MRTAAAAARPDPATHCSIGASQTRSAITAAGIEGNSASNCRIAGSNASTAEPGFALAKRSVPKDLASLFDQLMSPYDTPAHGVAYGNRRYRKPVILAAALRCVALRCTRPVSVQQRTGPAQPLGIAG